MARSGLRMDRAQDRKAYHGRKPLNKQELVSAVADEADLPKAKASEVVDAVFASIEKALKNKQEVRLVGFGTFVTASRKAAKGRNPRTGEKSTFRLRPRSASSLARH